MSISQVDMFKGEDITKKLCTFNVSQPLNSHFKDSDIATMNFMRSIGSIIIPLYVFVVVTSMKSKLMFKLALCCFKNRKCRKVAMYLEPMQQNFMVDSGKVFKESFYELSIGVYLHTYMFKEVNDDFGYRYFGSACDASASILMILTSVLMVVLPMHAAVLICRSMTMI